MKIASMALVLAISAAAASADPAGMRLAAYDLPHHGSDTRVAIWYPNGGAGEVVTYAGNPVFRGVETAMGAEIEAGQHPLVLFSHGLGGTDRAQAWLASELAQRGAIVVVVNHPNSTWGDFDMSEGADHWTRVADLSVALDTVTSDPDFAPHIDMSRIMAAGFSFGGWTAMSMGGATGNLDGFVGACTAHMDAMEACELFLSDDVSVQTKEPDMWNANYQDDRVTHVVAIDPGFVWGLKAANVDTLAPQTVLIGLGDATDRLMDTDFDASGLATLLPEAEIHRLAPAFHFTAMPLCTERAVALLEADGDDPVCSDPPGTDRAGVHATIVEIMAAEIGL